MKNLGMTFFLAVAFLFTATLAQAQSAQPTADKSEKVACNKNKTACKGKSKATKVSLTSVDAKKCKKTCSPADCKKAGKTTTVNQAPNIMTASQDALLAPKKKNCNPASCTKKPASCNKKATKVTQQEVKPKTTKRTL